MFQRYDVPFTDPKLPICPEQNFWVQTSNITFIYLLALFIVQNLKKDPEMRMHHFWAQISPFAPNKIIFGK